MKDIKTYIIEENLKDKIKGWINKFKKSKEPEKIWSDEDLQEFKNKTITEEDADKIIDIREKIEKSKNSDYLFGTLKISGYSYTLRKLAYKQAILDYAYLNFKNELNRDKYGEDHANAAYYKACKDNGYDSSSVAAGSIALPVLSRYFYGWSCAEELKLKCETKIKVDFKINK